MAANPSGWSVHPRLRHYPYHEDYLKHSNEYRPFVVTMGEPNYRSSSLNTDELGFRVQHFHEGAAIEFSDLKRRTEGCDLLLGGSTVFGVTASGDDKTIAAHLSKPGRPCINWGVRGATSQQELILYLTLKYLLPPQHNIILFTGMNDVSLATLPGTLKYPAFGGVFGHDYLLRRLAELEEPRVEEKPEVPELKKLYEHIQELWDKHDSVRRLVRAFYRRHDPQVRVEERILPVENQFRVVAALVENAIETWSWIQSATGTRVHYVLQPAIGWSRKPLTHVERECFEEDVRTIASVKLFTDRGIYERFRDHVKGACARASLRFYDANEWLDAPEFRGEDVFTDSCHFNDRGYLLMARLLRDRLEWGLRA